MKTTIDFEEKGGLLRCRFSGNLDTTFCMGQGEEIRRRACEAAGLVIFDMKGAVAVCSMFLGMCVLLHRDLGERFSIEGCGDDLYATFRAVRLDRILNIS